MQALKQKLALSLVVLGCAVAAVAASASASPGAASLRNGTLVAKDANPGSQISTNWAGFIVAGPGAAATVQRRVSFTRVAGTWTEPTATCDPNAPTSSAFWVGLGGASETSQALEQIGTAADCSFDGTPQYYAWYEIVPAPARPIRIAINPGDTISAFVKYLNKKVTLTIKNLTQGTKYTRIVKFAHPDLSSAEWIAEAPSLCGGNGACHTLSLTNFGTVAFSGASATNGTKHTGTISDIHWGTTQVTLQSDAQDPFGQALQSGSATPSDLSPDGTAFSVAWQAPSQPQPQP
jgi:hypothetical protein